MERYAVFESFRLSRKSALLILLVQFSVLTAPTVNAAHGRTAGITSVSDDGAFNYTIPIFTPPGPRGIQPSVALSYSSNGGVGYVGRGWAISGLSAITRCNKTVAQDGAAAKVSLVAADAYCLDGNRLMLQSGTGTYGQNNSEWATEISDFSRIKATTTNPVTGPDSWVVERRDGTIWTYGTSTGSAVTASGIVHMWYVSEIRDRSANQNKVRFTYEVADGTTTGTTHPTKIEWTQTSAGSGTYLYSIDFAYSSGGNAQQSSYAGFVAGASVVDTDLLQSISVKNSGTTVRKYVLGYETSTSTGVKRLITVKECSDAAESDCLNPLTPTTITYQNGQTGFPSTASSTTSAGSSATISDGEFDYNADGFVDVTYRRSGVWYTRFGSASGFGSEISTGTSELTFVAFNPFGPGRTVILGRASGLWYAYQWNGSSFSATSTGVTSAVGINVRDVNADGRDDLVYLTNYPCSGCGPQTYMGIGVKPSTSTGATVSFGSVVETQYTPIVGTSSFPPASPPYFSSGILWPDRTSRERGQLDFNGDKRGDVTANGYFWYYVWSEYAQDYVVMWESVDFALLATDNLLFTDVAVGTYYGASLNSDPCIDSYSSTYVYLSDCLGSGTASTPSGSIVDVMDWNGDGRQDLIVMIGGTRYVQLATGVGFSSAVATGLPSCVGEFLDANGDGLTDYVCVSGSNLLTYLRNGSTTIPDLAVSIKDGFDVTQNVSYAISTLDGYTPGTSATYPQIDVTAPIVLARVVTAPDGAGGTYTNTYSYFSGGEDIQGRGFSGFDTVKVVDSRDGIQHYRRFMQGFPYSGMLFEEKSYQPGSTLITHRTNAYNSRILGTNRHFRYISSSTQYEYEVGGTRNGLLNTQVSISNTFDDYGNVTASTRTVTDNDSTSPYNLQSWVTTASTAYSPSTAYWCLGLPTSSAVTYSTTVSGESSVTRSKSYTPDYSYCRMDAVAIEPSSSTLRVDTGYAYDGFGNVTSVSVIGRNPNGTTMGTRATFRGWGATGQFPVSDNDALGYQTTRAFDATGNLLWERDPNGIFVIINSYDNFGRLKNASRPDGTYSTYDYDDCAISGSCLNGDPASSAGGLNKTTVVKGDWGGSGLINYWVTHLDQFDRPIVDYHLSTMGWIRTGRQYDNLGRVLRETAPCPYYTCTPYWTTNSYDLLGRLIQQTRPRSDGDPSLVTTTIAYAGRAQTVTDPYGKITTKVMDVNGWMRRSRDNDNYGQNFSYDAAGSLIGVTDTASNGLFGAAYYYGAKPFQYSTFDMDLGYWGYTYNSLGELVNWSDAKGQNFTQTFDALSRLLTRVEPDGSGSQTTTWVWGDGVTKGPYDIGRLAGISLVGPTVGAYGEEVHYNNKGQRTQYLTSADGSLYTFDYTYNNDGQLYTVSYPTSTSSKRLKVQYGYAYGSPQTVTDVSSPDWTGGSAGTVYWTANAENPRGQITQQTLGNGVVTSQDFDAVTGWVNSIQSLKGSTVLQNLGYAYYDVGAVSLRQENTIGLSESFSYDNVYRLTSSQVNANAPETVAYDVTGNITSKTGVGTYDYTVPQSGCSYYSYAQKHAVRYTAMGGGTAYCYDANGNMVSRSGTTFAWTSYNYLSSVNTGTESTAFFYGPNRQYYRQDYAGPSVTETTYYIGGLLEKVCPAPSCSSGTIDWRHHVKVGGQTVAIVSRKSTGTNSVSYPLEDNQGSVSSITNSSGGNVVRASYKAFGEQRDGDDWDGPEASGDLTTLEAITRRGYTRHNMLGRIGLIHMNGRVQDAVTGRFLSPDPYTFNPGNSQGFNRYSYVHNNPLTYSDPSGFQLSPEGDMPEIAPPGNRLSTSGGNPGAMLNPAGGSNPWDTGMTGQEWLDALLAQCIRNGACSEESEETQCPVAENTASTQIAIPWRGAAAGQSAGWLEALGRASVWMSALSIPSAADKRLENPNIPLYRSVGSEELAQIQLTQSYMPAPNGFGDKQFWLNPADAQWYGEMTIRLNWQPSATIVTSSVTRRTLQMGTSFAPDGNRPAVSFPTAALPVVSSDAAKSGGIRVVGTCRVTP